MAHASVKDICNFIWKKESELNLFHHHHNNVHLWPLIRFSVYHDITQKIETFGTPHPKNKSQSEVNISFIKKVLHGMVCKNPFFTKGPKQSIIIPHGRQVDKKDIYFAPLLSNLNPDDTLLLYKDWRGEHYPSSTTMDMALFLFLIIHQLYLILVFPYKRLYRSFPVRELSEAIYDEFKITVPIDRLLLRYYLYFKTQRLCLYALFKIKKSKTLYLTTSYVHSAAVSAAKKCGMKVIELQHGTLTRYHLGYSYPVSQDFVPYFPDELLCFGQFWIDATPLPTSVNARAVGFPYLESIIKDTKDIQKNETQILIASQGPIAKYLFPIAIQVAKKMPHLHFVYRLHPSERLIDYRTQNAFDTLPPNLRLSSQEDPNELSTYALMAQSAAQIGVSSTTLTEGLCFNCRVFVVKLPSYEYMDYLVEKGYVSIAHDADELASQINEIMSQTPKPINRDYFFHSLQEHAV